MMQRNEIEQCANAVLTRYGVTAAPYTQIKAICDGEHIKIKKTAFSRSMDGAFSVIDGEKIIFYNSNKVIGRQNFTKAHELGHYFLEHPLENGSMICCNSGISEGNQGSLPRIETEANYFATYFLMPKDYVLAEYAKIAYFANVNPNRTRYIDRQQHNIKAWTIISNALTGRFGVSKEALRYRLEELRLIRYNL